MFMSNVVFIYKSYINRFVFVKNNSLLFSYRKSDIDKRYDIKNTERNYIFRGSDCDKWHLRNMHRITVLYANYLNKH